MPQPDPSLAPARPPSPGPGPHPSGRLGPALVARLRQATAGLHAELESLPAMTRLMSPEVSRGDYLDYLTGMARVYMALEPPLLAALQSGLAGYPGLGPEVRPKLPALLADLADLGCPGPRAPPARPVPVPPDLGAAAGGAYVLEGATLGGRVIARHLRRRLGGGPQDPLARAGFLDFHGDPAAAWMGFAADLDRLVELGAIDPESAIAGARAAFGLALGLLAEP